MADSGVATANSSQAVDEGASIADTQLPPDLIGATITKMQARTGPIGPTVRVQFHPAKANDTVTNPVVGWFRNALGLDSPQHRTTLANPGLITSFMERMGATGYLSPIGDSPSYEPHPELGEPDSSTAHGYNQRFPWLISEILGSIESLRNWKPPVVDIAANHDALAIGENPQQWLAFKDAEPSQLNGLVAIDPNLSRKTITLGYRNVDTGTPHIRIGQLGVSLEAAITDGNVTLDMREAPTGATEPVLVLYAQHTEPPSNKHILPLADASVEPILQIGAIDKVARDLVDSAAEVTARSITIPELSSQLLAARLVRELMFGKPLSDDYSSNDVVEKVFEAQLCVDPVMAKAMARRDGVLMDVQGIEYPNKIRAAVPELKAALEGWCHQNIASVTARKGAVDSVIDSPNENQTSRTSLLQGLPNYGIREAIGMQKYYPSSWVLGPGFDTFFSIDTLPKVDVRDPETLERQTKLAAELAAQGLIKGLRLDHIDGITDPTKFLKDLQIRYALECIIVEAKGRDITLSLEVARATYEVRLREMLEKGHLPCLNLIVEKILTDGEQLPSAWAKLGVVGNTGHEAYMQAQLLNAHPQGAQRLGNVYQELRKLGINEQLTSENLERLLQVTADDGGGHLKPHDEYVKELITTYKLGAAKKHRFDQLLVSAAQAIELDSADFAGLSPKVVQHALALIAAHYPRYRGYVPLSEDGQVALFEKATADALSYLHRRVENSEIENSPVDMLLYKAIEKVGRLIVAEPSSFGDREQGFKNWLSELMSHLPTIHAKGVEDWLYFLHALPPHTLDVGSSLKLSVSVQTYHEWIQAVTESDYKRSMTAFGTHDSKQSPLTEAALVACTFPEVQDHIARLMREIVVHTSRPIIPARLEYDLVLRVLSLEPPRWSNSKNHKQMMADTVEKILREGGLYAKYQTGGSTPKGLEHQDRRISQAKNYVEWLLTQRGSTAFTNAADTIRAHAEHDLFGQLLLTMCGGTMEPDIYPRAFMHDAYPSDPFNRQPLDMLAFKTSLDTAEAAADWNAVRNKPHHTQLLYVDSRLRELRRKVNDYQGYTYTPLPSGSDKDHDDYYAALWQRDRDVVIIGRSLGGASVTEGRLLSVPDYCAGKTFECVLTRKRYTALTKDGSTIIPLGAVHSAAPVMALRAV